MSNIANQPSREVIKQVLGRAVEAGRRLLDDGLDFNDLQRIIDDPKFRKRLVAYAKAGALEVEINVVRITVDPDVPLDYDKTKDGWKYLSDVKKPIGELTLELVEFLEEGETYIIGEELVKRAKKKDVLLGQRHAEALLRNQDAIPEEWRKYYLVFPGSVLQAPGGDRRVPFLFWGGAHWFLPFIWLERDFSSFARLVGSRK